jgi:hypothetical protein
MKYTPFAYNNTPTNSALRKFLVDDVAQTSSWINSSVDREHLPKDFLVNVLQALEQRSAAPGGIKETSKEEWIHKRKLEICDKYHDHVDSIEQRILPIV